MGRKVRGVKRVTHFEELGENKIRRVTNSWARLSRNREEEDHRERENDTIKREEKDTEKGIAPLLGSGEYSRRQ